MDLPLAYNSNLHPAESLRQIAATLRDFAGGVRAGLGWPALGVDLRLGSQALAEYRADPAAAELLRRACDAAKVIPYTINAFPLQHFQAPVVKDDAYRPDWLQAQRLTDTLSCIDLALAISDERLITISTLPGSCKLWPQPPRAAESIAAALGHWAATAYRRLAETGRRVVLCLEPEPYCLLENSLEMAAFWRGPLATAGLAAAAAALDDDQQAASAALAGHLACCFDTCHFSLGFEDQATAAARLAACGAGPLKVQFSAAPECPDPGANPAGLRSLQALHEPRFLHQCAARGADGVLHQVPDLDRLPELVAACPQASAIRAHFHLPVDRSPSAAGLRSTIADSLAGLQACRQHGARHIAVETYTWSILASDDAARMHGTIDELSWLAARLSAA